MQLADYLRVLRRRWWLVALSAVVCVVAAWVVDATRTPRFTSSTRLLVTGSVAGGAKTGTSAPQLASARAAAYAQLIQTGPGLEIAAETAGVLGNAPTVIAVADGQSPFITITVEANTARGAQALAASFQEALPQIVASLEQIPQADDPTLTTVDPAVLPAAPTSPRPLRDTSIALVIGLVLGLASALLRESLDVRLRDSAELERIAGVTVLGLVPRGQSGGPLPAWHQPRSTRSEAYRQVRANLEFSGADGLPASLAITSPGPGEGKSTLVANLAVVVAQSGRSVVVVDADLRRPVLASYFGVQVAGGLSDVLLGRLSLGQVVVPLGNGVSVLPSGPVPDFPSELVGSAAMLGVIEELERHFDLVIVDTPPVLPVPDALQIGVNVGGVVLVARMAETSRGAVRRAVEAVATVNGRLLGVVGNAILRHEEKLYGAGYGYGYTARRSAAAGFEPAHSARLAPAARRAAEPPRRGRVQGRRVRTEPAPPPAAGPSFFPGAELPAPGGLPLREPVPQGYPAADGPLQANGYVQGLDPVRGGGQPSATTHRAPNGRDRVNGGGARIVSLDDLISEMRAE